MTIEEIEANCYHIEFLLSEVKRLQESVEFWKKDSKLEQAHGLQCEAEVKRLREGIEAYKEYVILLTDELNEVVGSYAISHGWKSDRVEAGEMCREKIKKLLESK